MRAQQFINKASKQRLEPKYVAEGDLDRFKKYIRPVVKTTPKIEKKSNPAGRSGDHNEWVVTTPTGEIHRYNSKKQAQEHYDSFGQQGVAEGLNEFAQGDFNSGDDSNDLQLYLNVAKKLNMKKYKPSTAHDLIAKKMAELVDVVDDDKVDYARHMARKAQGLTSMLDQQGVAEGSLTEFQDTAGKYGGDGGGDGQRQRIAKKLIKYAEKQGLRPGTIEVGYSSETGVYQVTGLAMNHNTEYDWRYKLDPYAKRLVSLDAAQTDAEYAPDNFVPVVFDDELSESAEQGVAEAVGAGQYAKLYHSTPAMHLDAILQSGYLAPTGNPAYLSLTRDSRLDYGSWGGEFVEFDIDQNAVRQRIKLEPYNHSATIGGPRAAGGGESEERTKQKLPLKGFVTAMHAPTGWDGDRAGEHYSGLLKKYGIPIIYDIVPKLEEQGVAEELTPDQQFDIIEEMVEQVAAEHGVDPDVIWEDFEAVNDHELFESAAWRRKEGKNKKGGLNAKGVASYRRENPGSKLQTAVTTKPSKLKPGSKAAKRRKSFCARMGGMKGAMKKDGKPTRKALALRKWNC
jgi:hypothetical protein